MGGQMQGKSGDEEKKQDDDNMNVCTDISQGQYHSPTETVRKLVNQTSFVCFVGCSTKSLNTQEIASMISPWLFSF